MLAKIRVVCWYWPTHTLIYALVLHEGLWGPRSVFILSCNLILSDLKLPDLSISVAKVLDDALARVVARVSFNAVAIACNVIQNKPSCLAMAHTKRPHAVVDEGGTDIVAVESAQSNLRQSSVGPLTFGPWD